MKIKSISALEAKKWYEIANTFARSFISQSEAIHQFNQVTKDDRLKIRQAFSEYDSIRRKMLPIDQAEEEMKDAYYTSVLVDCHIIATEFSIDPVVATMCLTPPCSPNEKVLVKTR